MFGQVVYYEGSIMANAVVRQMHNLVTYGPWDLDVASAMSAHGYDEVKWAEGQAILAELVSSDTPARSTLSAAQAWYKEAAATARGVLATQPQLLAKLGLVGSGLG
jgi:hypothetical protein